MTEEEKQAKKIENEQFYDTEIAPVLAQLAHKCKERGMGLMCGIYNLGDTYSSIMSSDYMCPSERIARMAIKSLGNADLLINSLLKDAEEYGHNSVHIAAITVQTAPKKG